MKKTAAMIMALGLTLPAITQAQDSADQRPPRGERPAARDGASPDAQRPPFNREGGPGERRQQSSPLMAALDADHDGVISEAEIKNAPAALAKLDKNSDGKITMDELRPPRPNGDRVGGPDDRGAGPGAGDGPQRRGGRPPEGQ